MLYGTIISVCTAFFLFIFFSPFFTIEYVDVVLSERGIEPSAVRAVAFTQMERSLFRILPRRNIFIFSAQDTERELKRRFVIERVNIQKRLPHTISIELAGKPFRLLFVSGGRVFALAPDGTIGEELTAQPTEGKSSIALARALAEGGDSAALSRGIKNVDAPIVVAQGEGAALDAAAIEFTRTLFERSKVEGYAPLFFSVETGTPTLRMKSAEGWSALFSMLEPAAPQLHALQTVMKNSFKKNRKAIDYIDVRFRSRVFYKKL